MKIKDIKAVKFKLPFPKYKTEVRRPAPTGLATDTRAWKEMSSW